MAPRRHMIDPMPTERVVVDREFPCSSLNRRTRSEQPFDPHPLGVVASPTASCPRTLFSRHRLSPMIFFKNSWAAMVPLPQDDHKLIAHNYGAVMAVSAEPDGYLNTVEDLGFFKATEPIFASFKRNIPGG